MDQVKDLIVMEQLVNMLPMDVQIFVTERKPKSSAEAAKLADDYWQARKPMFGKRAGYSRQSQGVKQCQT